MFVLNCEVSSSLTRRGVADDARGADAVPAEENNVIVSHFYKSACILSVVPGADAADDGGRQLRGAVVRLAAKRRQVE